MKITDVHEIIIHSVETDGDQYVRYGPDSWCIRPGSWFIAMGDSDEPLYGCEEIEALFQEYIKRD